MLGPLLGHFGFVRAYLGPFGGFCGAFVGLVLNPNGKGLPLGLNLRCLGP